MNSDKVSQANKNKTRGQVPTASSEAWPWTVGTRAGMPGRCCRRHASSYTATMTHHAVAMHVVVHGQPASKSATLNSSGK